jgi:hypothetical protein
MRAIYEYKCRSCGTVETSDVRADSMGECPNCFGYLTRLYSVSVAKSMPEHFNPTVGKHISSMRQFDDELKRKSDEYYLRTGIEAKFVSHDASDAAALGVTNEGIDASNRQRHKEGVPLLNTGV